ncbi:MAG TPA: hypothetical protein VI168_00860 [Croceibacterium sp.]
MRSIMQHIVITPSEAALRAPLGFLVPDTREAIEMAVESFLARLDEFDGDPDLEDNHDREADMSDLEPDDDAQGDVSYAEWHTLTPATRRAGRIEGKSLHPWFSTVREDDEDDDSDRCAAGDDHMIAGAVAQRELYSHHKYRHIGDETDAEPNGDVELNGDEGDYDEGV